MVKPADLLPSMLYPLRVEVALSQILYMRSSAGRLYAEVSLGTRA